MSNSAPRSTSRMRRVCASAILAATTLAPVSLCAQSAPELDPHYVPAPATIGLQPPAYTERVPLSPEVTEFLTHPAGQTEQNRDQPAFASYIRYQVELKFTLGDCQTDPAGRFRSSIAPIAADASQARMGFKPVFAAVAAHACAKLAQEDFLARPHRLNLAQNR